VTGLFSKATDKSKAATKRESKIEPRGKTDAKKAEQVPEKILDEDRQKLEDILKRRQ
jgi:hypothetical protein